MAEFKISRIRYTWRSNWATSTSYNKDDVVLYAGSSWICIRQHTSSNFNADFTFVPPGDTVSQPAWKKHTDGVYYRGSWATATDYFPGEVVSYGGNVWLVGTAHTSGTYFDDNLSDWTVIAQAVGWKGDWATSTRYGVGDQVRYNGIVYRCITGHTSAATTAEGLELDQVKWGTAYTNIHYAGEWASDTKYKANDIVEYGGTLMRVLIGHVSGSSITDSNFTVYIAGHKLKGTWDSTTYYAIGDVVQHGGYVYRASANSYGRTPGDSIYQPDGGTYWAIIEKGFNLRGPWAASGNYKTGDVVQRGGNLYIALLDSTDDGSSLDYLDAGNWEVVVESQAWKGSWVQGTVYAVNDVIIYRGTAYSCNYEHEATAENFPGDNGSGFVYWDVLLLGDDQIGMINPGDLLTYGLTRTLAGDQSTLGAANVPIGNQDELLTVQSEQTLGYDKFGLSSRFFYVDPYNGVDDRDNPNAGIDPFKPLKTIRYALERANDEYTGTTTVKLSTGDYTEILPLIIPAKTSLLGDELRSTTVRPNEANTALSGDTVYRFAALNHLKNVARTIILNNSVTRTAGNEEEQVYVIDSVFSGEYTAAVVGEGGEIIQPGQPIYDDVPIYGDDATANQIDNRVTDFIDYVNFHINSVGTDVDVTGTNDLSSDSARINGARAIGANAKFLAHEVNAYMKVNYPDYTGYPEALYVEDVQRYVDAFVYDLRYTGNYRTILESRYYANQINGSQREDMFYCRDATGVRNLTVKNLTGTLNPPNVFDLYQRPTGPAYCSLDPGWGPADEKCWIATRSPYIQNVTTFGDNCTGQKIDGSLHNGGYKSMVSNDFTQVISDGIGAHVLNNGRAELVSVFTYYSQVGYLAETGGTIRATNGNNSYGYIGALADGNDPSETPLTATVNGRTEHAKIASAFAGEVNDEILLFEYTNCGQNYTTAEYTVIGSGTNAEVIQEEFRDDSLFEARIVTGASSGAAGGGGYIQVGNQAQSGDETSITLATNDDNEEAYLLGCRIIITSGDGTGQYGKVASYNTTTKVLNVVKESTGEPGWDHVIPGYPIKTSLTTSARYLIEPRLTFSAPEFSQENITLDAGTQWSSIAYNETTFTYTSITGTGDQNGSTIDVLPATASWDVKRSGKYYTVTIRGRGAGYTTGDTITIPGTDLGGVSPDNDLVITVLSTSDDSINEIVTFEYAGTATSGIFCVVSAIGNTANISKDGTTWTTNNLPSTGNWISITGGHALSGNYVLATVKYGSNNLAYTLDGNTWGIKALPASANWESITSGGGVYVAVASDGNNACYSTDGINYTAANIPAFGDSTINQWKSVAYGKGKFVAVAQSNNFAVSGAYDSVTDTFTWETPVIMDVIADSSQKDWIKIAYGNNRFVAISEFGDIAYSFDGDFWYPGTMPTPDGSTRMTWRDLKFGGGMFIATMDTGGVDISGDDPTAGPVNYIYQSYDGINWELKSVVDNGYWGPVAFGNPDVTTDDGGDNRKGQWILISRDITFTHKRFYTGARALGRVVVGGGRISEVRLWEPGSGYAAPPTFTIVDPNNTGDLELDLNRMGDRVLAQPSWINRGNAYKTSTTQVTVTGDGFADIVAVGKFLTISDINTVIGPGAQLRLSGNPELYTVVLIEKESEESNGTFTLRLRVTPELKIEDDPSNFHGNAVEIRLRYSNCRITGHDFLDVGTGNFLQSNYPELYSGNYVSYPENEVIEQNGGRVFYTSTDQSGNFRVGELFAVEQATGIVTISADFFDLNGLTELALGGIRVGGTGTVIREFSTDPLFTADSNNIVPTQRAIKAYLQNRLNVGGADLLTASFIAGTVKVGPGEIGNSAGLRVTIPVKTKFVGDEASVQGSILAQAMFHRSFDKNNSR